MASKHMTRYSTALTIKQMKIKTTLISHPLERLRAPLVKNPPAMQETWVQSLDWEDLLEESLATYSSVLAWRIPMDKGAWQATKSWTQQATKHFIGEVFTTHPLG